MGVKKRVANKDREDPEVGASRAGTEGRTGEGGEALPPDVGFGDDVIHDHIDHGAGSKGQSIGQDGLRQHHGKGTKDPGQRLHHAAELPVPKERTETRPTAGRVKQTQARSDC